MKSKVFRDGGGAGIGSYIIVIDHNELHDANPNKIRDAFDNGDTLYLSIIDDTTEETLLPLTGYVDTENILHLIGRDFDDAKTYNLILNGVASVELEIEDGISLGDTTLDPDMLAPPVADGKYVLTATVLNGNVTYSWEAGGSGTELTPEAQEEILDSEF